MSRGPGHEGASGEKKSLLKTPAPPPVVGGGAVSFVQGKMSCLPAGRRFALQGWGGYFTNSIFFTVAKPSEPSAAFASSR